MLFVVRLFVGWWLIVVVVIGCGLLVVVCSVFAVGCYLVGCVFICCSVCVRLMLLDVCWLSLVRGCFVVGCWLLVVGC